MGEAGLGSQKLKGALPAAGGRAARGWRSVSAAPGRSLCASSHSPAPFHSHATSWALAIGPSLDAVKRSFLIGHSPPTRLRSSHNNRHVLYRGTSSLASRLDTPDFPLPLPIGFPVLGPALPTLIGH